ncbi:MAG: GGDEF domain-containing protein [bacterium]|nr:GGDEF domain-containing protein [bacterium]
MIKTKIPEYIRKLPKVLIIILGILLVAFFGFIDYFTGYEISISIFYLIPISLIAWFAGNFSAAIISILSVIVWALSDLASAKYYSHPVIPLWNSFILLGFFLIITFALTEIKSLLENERELALTDPLTKIANARGLYKYMQFEIDRAIRFGRPLTIAYIDLDNFKFINDTHGHSAGDKVLQVVAGTIKENIRSIDIVARIGGDEFVILMPETGEEHSRIAIDKILKYLLNIVEENKWPITFSIGAAIYHNPPRDMDKLIKTADELMYSIKKAGKNNIMYKIITGTV